MADTIFASDEPVAGRQMTRRYWRRRSQAASWWPWGLLPLLGLLALFLFGALRTAPAIEAQTEQQVSSVLAASGLPGFSVKADGQEVVISGSASEADRDKALALALTTGCSTWVAGERVCPNTVRVAMAAGSVTPAAVTGAQLPRGRFHNFNLRETDTRLVLSGEVPNEVVHAAIVAAAGGVYSSVTDEITVTGETATDGFDWAVDRAISLLARLTDGDATWRDGSLSASGVISRADEAQVRRDFVTTTFADRLGALTLQSLATDAEVCNQQFAAALSASSIVFQTGSAAISPESQSLIEELVALAMACPVDLRVEGHTDSEGSAELNTSLSLARAEAVVAALAGSGIDAARLSAEGYGPSQPVADNATAQGRVRNRRIEIKAVEQ